MCPFLAPSLPLLVIHGALCSLALLHAKALPSASECSSPGLPLAACFTPLGLSSIPPLPLSKPVPSCLDEKIFKILLG